MSKNIENDNKTMKSNDSDFNLIVSSIRDLSEKFINAHIKEFGKFPTQEEVKKCFLITPGFACTTMFLSLFPIIYEMIHAEYANGRNKNDETSFENV
jgi:hypothetical protein